MPSRAELRDLILQHGGSFEAFETSRVTHVIASNLPNTKVRQYLKKKHPTPVVRPDWIVEGIARQKLLPVRSFLLEPLQNKQTRSLEETLTHSRPTAKDGAAFVKQFFQKSRLHHIGSWKNHFQETVRKFHLSHQKPVVHHAANGKLRCILHVDMDCFFVSVAIRRRPELATRPIAIAHSDKSTNGKGFSEISSCNYVARKFGLKAGMFMRQAKELCPDLLVLAYDFDAIREVCLGDDGELPRI